MLCAARSLTLLPGLLPSSLAKSRTPGLGLIRPSSTSGVLPMLSIIPAISFSVFGVNNLNRRLVIRRGMGWYAGCQPYIAPDDTVITDDRIAAQNRRAGVHHHPIADRGMPFSVRTIFVYAERAERHALVYLHVVADLGGLRSEEHTSELQSRENLVCRLLLEKKNYIVTL